MLLVFDKFEYLSETVFAIQISEDVLAISSRLEGQLHTRSRFSIIHIKMNLLADILLYMRAKLLRIEVRQTESKEWNIIDVIDFRTG